jgi:hypothetical protein
MLMDFIFHKIFDYISKFLLQRTPCIMELNYWVLLIRLVSWLLS